MVDVDVSDAAAEVLVQHLKLGGQRGQTSQLERPGEVHEPLTPLLQTGAPATNRAAAGSSSWRRVAGEMVNTDIART